jgi:hypothetical protein
MQHNQVPNSLLVIQGVQQAKFATRLLSSTTTDSSPPCGVAAPLENRHSIHTSDDAYSIYTGTEAFATQSNNEGEAANKHATSSGTAT